MHAVSSSKYVYMLTPSTTCKALHCSLSQVLTSQLAGQRYQAAFPLVHISLRGQELCVASVPACTGVASPTRGLHQDIGMCASDV